MKNILLFSGSNSPQSINQKLITGVSGLLTETSNTILDLTTYDLPIYSIVVQYTQGVPEQILRLGHLIIDADLLIISVPEHNGSMPSFFKNILDWLSRSKEDYKALHNKQVILFSASPGAGGASALMHAETVLIRLGAIVKARITVNNFFKKTSMAEGKLHFTDNMTLNEIQGIIKTIIN